MEREIDWLPIPGLSGVLGLTSAPGCGMAAIMAGRRAQKLDDDIAAIRRVGVEALVTLMEPAELRALGLDGLGEQVAAAGLAWYHMPIPDFAAPNRAFEGAWREHGPALHTRLEGGGRVVMHCLAGLGRTGTVAARMLIERGDEPEDAVRRVRAARPGSIQSGEQLAYLLERRWLAA